MSASNKRANSLKRENFSQSWRTINLNIDEIEEESGSEKSIEDVSESNVPLTTSTKL